MVDWWLVNISHQASRSRLSDAKQKKMKEEEEEEEKRSGIGQHFASAAVPLERWLERLSPASGPAQAH